ncbi:MAG: hypothetical protein NW205_02335 [Hyphomicrobiaceae bacterium]|nr:hypothetical protein [Hyphomicrobiaceae bacterium]
MTMPIEPILIDLPRRAGLVILAAAFIVASALVANAGPGRAGDGAGSAFGPVLVKEGRSQRQCESDPQRVFVRHVYGTACIAYFTTRGHERKSSAVVFMDGDSTPEAFADAAGRRRTRQAMEKILQNLADQQQVRIVMLYRLGLDGSSGNHAERRRPFELHAMQAAIDELKGRLRFEDVVLAGQSGGATLAASMLTLGRADVTCAALGSGAYALGALVHASLAEGTRAAVSRRAIDAIIHDPSRHIAGIPTDRRRTVFVIGDRRDGTTPFAQQRRFAEALNDAGHHAELVAVRATGEEKHGTAGYALRAAALCARRAPAAEIVAELSDISDRIVAAAEPTQPVVSASAGASASVRSSGAPGSARAPLSRQP